MHVAEVSVASREALPVSNNWSEPIQKLRSILRQATDLANAGVLWTVILGGILYTTVM